MEIFPYNFRKYGGVSSVNFVRNPREREKDREKKGAISDFIFGHFKAINSLKTLHK